MLRFTMPKSLDHYIVLSAAFDKEVISCGVDRRKILFDVTNYAKLNQFEPGNLSDILQGSGRE